MTPQAWVRQVMLERTAPRSSCSALATPLSHSAGAGLRRTSRWRCCPSCDPARHPILLDTVAACSVTVLAVTNRLALHVPRVTCVGVSYRRLYARHMSILIRPAMYQ